MDRKTNIPQAELGEPDFVFIDLVNGPNEPLRWVNDVPYDFSDYAD
jgi:hypothetical protein